jgi:hypothetical protein
VWIELKRFLRLPGGRKWVVCEALLALMGARLAIAVFPFRRIAAWLGTPGVESCGTAPPEQVELAQMVGWAVERLGRRVPWDARCLTQAIAAWAMLRRRGLYGAISFGAAKGESGELMAHAWLRFGPCVVTGDAGHEEFKVLTTLARAPR